MINSYADFYKMTYEKFDGDFKSLRLFSELCDRGEILDLGAGFGRTLRAFQGRSLILLENSEDMIALLKDKIGDDSNHRVLKGTALKIPLENTSVCGAFSAFGSISEMQPDFFTLKEIARVLSQNGLFYFLVPNPLAYKTGSLGIRRSAGFEDTFSVETFPISSVGPHEYLTVVQLRRSAAENYCVFQCYPPIEYWKNNLRDCGLSLEYMFGDFDCGPFVESESPILIGIARKVQNAISIEHTDDQARSLAQIYDSFAAKYDQITEKGKYGVPKWLNEKLKAYIGRKPNVLDLGCANGFIGKVIKANGIQPLSIFGFDISSDMVEQCQKSGIYDGVAQVDISKSIPIAKSGYFDLITSFGVLEFIQDQAKLLIEIRRLLSIGGEALISFESLSEKSNENIESEVEKITAFGSVLLKKRVSKKYIEKICKIANLEILEILEGHGYTSPSSGANVNYFFVRLLKRGC